MKNITKAFFALGNPGSEYENTRHNAGFLFVDYLIENFFKKPPRVRDLKKTEIFQFDELLLVKSKTFMNESGVSAREFVKWFDIDTQETFILVHDDLDLELGNYKYHSDKSPKQHNGVVSVENHLGTNKFNRLRIGIDNREGKKIDGKKYVLSEFSEDELVDLKTCFDEIIEKLQL